MAGYSATPLLRKLGIQAAHRVALVNAPDTLEDDLGELPPAVRLLRGARRPVHVTVAFFDRERDYARRLPTLLARLPSNGALWIGWPKKSSGRTTDLDFNAVQTAGLAAGLVDNKICAIDDTWSGLRFVVRRDDRMDWPVSPL